MFKRDPAARIDAVQMFAAVKTGQLAGIYIVNQGAPALRARKLNTWWLRLQIRGHPDLECPKRHQSPAKVVGVARRHAPSIVALRREPGRPVQLPTIAKSNATVDVPTSMWRVE